ncbi:MAG TPA: hypothetical protein VK436_10670 [Methanocella sp.]|nr:hypothetical protein [Methanocella sp.]
MSDTDTTKQKKKRSLGFDDILSILEDKKTRSLARPDAAQAGEKGLQSDKHAVETNDPSQISALSEDSSLMVKLLSDIDQKNSEITRLNNELIQARYDLQDKTFKVNNLATEIAGKDLKIKELDIAVDGLNTELHLLKKSAASNPVQPESQHHLQVSQQEAQALSEPIQPAQTVDHASKTTETVQTATAEQPQTAALAPQVDEAGTRPIKEDYKVKEDVAEEDVATIFKRIVSVREESSSGEKEAPKRPKSAKLYDL